MESAEKESRFTRPGKSEKALSYRLS